MNPRQQPAIKVQFIKDELGAAQAVRLSLEDWAVVQSLIENRVRIDGEKAARETMFEQLLSEKEELYRRLAE